MNVRINIDLTAFSLFLFAIFLGLKLTHVINWSWLWVFSPLWIPVLIVFAFSVIAILVVGISNLIHNIMW